MPTNSAPAHPSAGTPAAGHRHDRADDWHRIEKQARERAASQMPPQAGAYIAWAITTRCGPTSAVSKLHRVGEPIRGEPYTTCREAIPAPVMWMPLSPGMIRTMERCGFCEAGRARVEHAA